MKTETDLSDYETLRHKVESLRREADRERGALDEALRRLRETFDCKTVQEGKILHKKLHTQKAALKEKFNAALSQLKKDYPHVLD